MRAEACRESCIFTWSGERQLLPVYERLLALGHETDCLLEAQELLTIQKEEMTDCDELLASLEVEIPGHFTAIVIPEDFDSVVILIYQKEVSLLDDGYLKIDPHVHEPLHRHILDRVTRRQARQIHLIRVIAQKRRIVLPVTPTPPAPPGPPPARLEYIVQPGDTMYQIASRFGVSLEHLIRANPQIRNPESIFPGEIIYIPRAPGAPAGPPPTTPGARRRYIVQEGDTMFLISQRFGIGLSELIAFNPQITNPAALRPGEVVFIPTREAVG